ncbi:MAG TPA: hypothetical protein DD706_24415 [Nitrospiraceae bacterium]|nr:hypothetical protein [Nitrospiraceae bacterium]
MVNRTSYPVLTLLEKKRRESKQMVIVSISLTILGTIGFALYPIFGEVYRAQASTLFALIGGLLTIFFLSLGLTNDLQAEITRLCKTVEDQAECVYLGNVTGVAEGFKSRVEGAERVRNTFVVFRLSDEEGEFRRYTSMLPLDKREEIVRSVIDRGKSWIDIFSEESLASDDFKLRALVARLQRNFPTYEACCLKTSYPIVNFCLIDREGKGVSEVLFGWGFHPSDKAGIVYSSKDPEVFHLFDHYWQTLKQDTMSVWSAGQTCMNMQDITGLWCSLAYKDGDSDHITNEAKLENMALVEITISDGRKPNLEVQRYDPETLSPLGNIIRSKSTDLCGRELWFVAEECTTLMAGSYKFVREPESGTKDGKKEFNIGPFLEKYQVTIIQDQKPQEIPMMVERYYGYFVQFDQRGGENKGKIFLFGHKVKDMRRIPDDPQKSRELLTAYKEKTESRWQKEPASSRNGTPDMHFSDSEINSGEDVTQPIS